MSEKLKVGILGATGMVGQRFIQLLDNHPDFEITAFTIDNTYSNPKTSFILLTIPDSASGMYRIALITPAIKTSLV